MTGAVRCLSFHAHYRCRHSGDCCTAGWPIPDDRGGLLPRTAQGCAHHDAASQRCTIHAAHGHDALPLACRQFPRITVHDPRGVSVTLSCYCPTARALLDDDTGAITVIDSAPAFPPHGEYVGLDARTSLPPALCPDVLMDWDSWWEWERLSVELWNLELSPREILARLSRAVDQIRTWRPTANHGQLIDRVRDALREARIVKSGINSPNCFPISIQHRFLACHTFGNWTAYTGAGLRTWLRSIETVLFLLENGWSIAEIDLWLRHWADPAMLAQVWSAAEREGART